MKGYLIANLDIHDQPIFQRYREMVVPIIAKYGGRYIVRGGEVENLEGHLSFNRLIVLEFPSPEVARAFYEGPEYQPVKAIRFQSATSDVALVVGYDDA